jgi:alpha 1,3-glucosidase
MFPKDEAGFAIDDQYYIGDSGLLFKPVTTQGATTSTVYISDNQVSFSLSSTYVLFGLYAWFLYLYPRF